MTNCIVQRTLTVRSRTGSANGQRKNSGSESTAETWRRLERLPLLERFERRKGSIEVPILRLLPGLLVNSKTNDPEEAYRQLLDVRRATTEGVRLLPSEASKVRYEDLRAILLDYYREHKPRSITRLTFRLFVLNRSCRT